MFSVNQCVVLTALVFMLQHMHTILLNLRKRIGGTAVAQWLRYCATNQKVADSIPDDVVEFFININPSDRTVALGSTQPLTEMSTRGISWG
jgi:predicted alpha/beta hydrolase